MIVYFVYLLTFANGKIYIGMSRTDGKGLFTSRYRNHAAAAKKGKSLPIYNAWRKHGAPIQSIISKHEIREDCSIAEIHEIRSRKSMDISIGYNVLAGGQGQDSATNPKMHALMTEKVWNNPEWRKKVSDALKGRQPSQATKDAYAAFCKTPAKSEAGKKAWRDPEYRAMKAEITRQQMANGGAEHLSNLMTGRPDPLTKEGRESQRRKVKEYYSTDEGKAAARRGYDAFASNPANLAANRAALDNWRASDKNKLQCQEMAKKSAEKCSKKVQDLGTGIVYNSQRDMARALGVSEAAISLRVKVGKIKRV